MDKLLRKLATIRQGAYNQGNGLSTATIKAVEAFRHQAAIASGIVLAAAVALFLLAFAVSIYYLRDPAHLGIVFGGVGVSLAGALTALRSTWKDWSQTNLLLALFNEADDEQVKSLLDLLIKKV